MKEARVKHTRFNRWVWRTFPECREMVKIITASMDEKLSWGDWLRLKIHLLSCDPCVNFIKQLKFIRTALRIRDDHHVGEDTTVRLNERAKARMKEALHTTGS